MDRINEKLHNKQNITQSKLNVSYFLTKHKNLSWNKGLLWFIKGFIVYSESILHEHFSSSDTFQILEQNYFKCCGFTMGGKFDGW